AQLSCLARLLAAKNLTGDFTRYPPDLLLFFDLAKVPGGTCREFYAWAALGKLELLPRGSSQRTGLLRGALTCLGVRSSHLSPEQLSSLGGLVCDMEPETITASDPSILENLKLCPTLVGTQRDALNAVLLRGDTVYGEPSRWDLQTLQNLGPLVLALNQTTLSLVAKAAREAFGRSIMATYSSQGRSQREKSLTLLRAFMVPSSSSPARLKRSTEGCPSIPITATTVSDPLLTIYYESSEHFELCLSNEVLKANLGPLLQQLLTRDQQLVVKEKLEQIYPSGIPEEQLKLLGPLLYLYSAEEISRWMVTSNTTLLALLDPSYGKQEAPQVQQLFSRYLALGGTLTGPLLQKMGEENLCELLEEQIQQIPPEAIRTAQLSVSSCSQAKKDQLYRKAQEAFAGQAGTPRTYYCLIRPYLGGAPAEDLKALAEAGVAIDMDMDTFLALNPEELQKLSVLDVKNLLGENLPSLKEAENETLVMLWVKRQSQEELDCILGIAPGGPPPPAPTTCPIITLSTHNAPSTLVPNSTSPLVSTSPPAPGGPPPPAPTTCPIITLSTHNAPSTLVPNSTSPLVSTSPPAPGGITHPAPTTCPIITLSTHNAPSTLVPNSTSPLVSTS
ncbi:MSLNL protein, partial [Brachypteracias leptosomus]|nr:MSLNL protein [Brachypteracias leptosomus]